MYSFCEKNLVDCRSTLAFIWSFGDTREIFNIQFYIVAILFLLFDLEIAFIFPWAVYFNFIQLTGLFSMFFFLILLTVGFIFE